jgi:SAM-dependent methyltransferase
MNFGHVESELALFATARHWKAYLAAQLRPFIAGSVLEVGAGIGSNILFLQNPRVTDWTAVEPHPAQADRIRALYLQMAPCLRVVTGTLQAIDPTERFTTVLYIDVLEHVRDDAGELTRAAAYLRPGGNLIVAVPAHQFLFSPFDATIGHHRRYSLGRLTELTPVGCVIRRRMMLDGAGFFASLANRLLLRRTMPGAAQIAFWDSVLVRISRVLDPVTLHRFGKTAVTVWSRV